MAQVKIYTGKCLRLFVNEKSFKLFVSATIIAAIISWVAGENMFYTYPATRSGAFAVVCACIWIGIFNSIQSVCRERAIIKREYKTGLHLSSYIIAHMLYELLLCLVEALVSVIILYIFREPPVDGLFFPAAIELFITYFCIIYSADILGLLISCIVRSETTAMTVMPFVLILQLVLCGVVFELDGAADQIANITISKWGVNAICVIANVNSLKLADPSASEQFAYTFEHLLQLWSVLLCFIVLYSVLCVLALKLVARDKR